MILPLLVRRFLPLVALVLLGLWLPTTEFCKLDAAGFLPSGLSCPFANDGDCSNEICAALDHGTIKADHAVLKIPQPALIASPFLALEPAICSDHRVELAAVPAERFRLMDDPVSSWHFVRRMAPLSRAPSILGA